MLDAPSLQSGHFTQAEDFLVRHFLLGIGRHGRRHSTYSVHVEDPLRCRPDLDRTYSFRVVHRRDGIGHHLRMRTFPSCLFPEISSGHDHENVQQRRRITLRQWWW